MFSITVLAVGKLKEAFFLKACEEYRKRLGSYCSISIVELPENRLSDRPSAGEIEAALLREAEEIEKRIPKNAFFVICTPEGRQLSSEEFAEKLALLKKNGHSSVCFLVGGSFGIASSLKKKADFRLSISKMTFPHHLFRVLLLEQIYRAESIQAGTKYHK